MVKSQVLIALVFGDKLNTPNIEFGLNVGSNVSTLTNYPDAKYKSGFNLGLYFNFKLSDHFYLHPELLFIDRLGSKGVDANDLPDPGLDLPSLETWRDLNYLTLVFLPRYKLTNQVYFEAGIIGRLLVSADDFYHTQPADKTEQLFKLDVKGETTRMDVGATIGLGYKFGKGDGVNLSLRYSHGFINTTKVAGDAKQLNQSFHVQVGIPIGVGKKDVQTQVNQLE